NPPSVSGFGASTLHISTANNTPAGNYTLTIFGTGGGLTRSTTAVLNIAGFLLSTVPATQNIATNGATSYAIHIADYNGFGGTVALSVSGLPAGASGGFTPSSVSGSGDSTFNVTISGTTLPGSY